MSSITPVLRMLYIMLLTVFTDEGEKNSLYQIKSLLIKALKNCIKASEIGKYHV